MTEEQIKQNAINYSEPFWMNNDIRSYVENAHIAGAHSRDEEIKGLKEMYHDMFLVLANKVEQLRNPWISVEKQLPEHRRPIIFKCGDKAYGGWYDKEMKEFQTKAPDATNWTMDDVTSWYYQF